MQIDNIGKAFSAAGIDLGVVGGNLFTEMMKKVDGALTDHLPSLRTFMDSVKEFREETKDKIDEINNDALAKHNYQILKMRSDVDKLMKTATPERMANIDGLHSDT